MSIHKKVLSSLVVLGVVLSSTTADSSELSPQEQQALMIQALIGHDESFDKAFEELTQDVARKEADAKKKAEEERLRRQQEEGRERVGKIHRLTGLSVHASETLVSEAKKYNIPDTILMGLFETESTFNPNATNPHSGAAGLAQFERNTGKIIAERCGLPYSHDMLYDPEYSIKLAANYLDYLHEQTGSWEGALTAYNRGLGGYHAYLQETGTPVSAYSQTIMRHAHEFAQELGDN